MKKLTILLFFVLFSFIVYAQTEEAPAPIAPYSQYVMANGTLYISGQIPINPQTKELIKGDIKKETRQVMENIGAILKANGMDYSNLVRCTIYMVNLNNYEAVNEVYGSFFKDKKFPARAAIQISRLPLNANIEISGIAVKK